MFYFIIIIINIWCEKNFANFFDVTQLKMYRNYGTQENIEWQKSTLYNGEHIVQFQPKNFNILSGWKITIYIFYSDDEFLKKSFF